MQLKFSNLLPFSDYSASHRISRHSLSMFAVLNIEVTKTNTRSALPELYVEAG